MTTSGIGGLFLLLFLLLLILLFALFLFFSNFFLSRTTFFCLRIILRLCGSPFALGFVVEPQEASSSQELNVGVRVNKTDIFTRCSKHFGPVHKAFHVSSFSKQLGLIPIPQKSTLTIEDLGPVGETYALAVFGVDTHAGRQAPC